MKLDRLIGILTILLQNERISTPYLAEKFEVSRRTIGRDIDALCKAGIPVITYQGSGGGISIAEGFKLDKNILTSDELSGIIAALKGIGSVSEKSQVERTLDKLSANSDVVLSLTEPVVIDLASHYKGDLTHKIEKIKKAIRERRLIEFDYYYEKGVARRHIEPSFAIFYWSSWYVFGFCTLRQDFRLFKLQRLWNLRLCEETYIQREIPAEKRDFHSCLPDDKILVALFDPSIKYQLMETYGFDGYTETEGGLLRAEIGYTNREFMLAWLLGFGAKVKVLEPADLVNDIKRIASEILDSYS